MFAVFHGWRRAQCLSNTTPQITAGLTISLLSHSVCRATIPAVAVWAQSLYVLALKECISTSLAFAKTCHTMGGH